MPYKYLHNNQIICLEERTEPLNVAHGETEDFLFLTKRDQTVVGNDHVFSAWGVHRLTFHMKNISTELGIFTFTVYGSINGVDWVEVDTVEGVENTDDVAEVLVDTNHYVVYKVTATETSADGEGGDGPDGIAQCWAAGWQY